jgi:hypothetical protein
VVQKKIAPLGCEGKLDNESHPLVELKFSHGRVFA